MKVLLLVLSGEVDAARRMITQRYPQTVIEVVSRVEVESGSIASRLRALRKRRGTVIAIWTDRLKWQRGQNSLFLFGALAGAKEIVLGDAHGSLKSESRASLLFQAPWRIGSEAILSARILMNARRELRLLEKQIVGTARATKGRARAETNERSREIIYLRATPGPGTQPGGASSHIKGVTEALVELGARVKLISNDAIAGLNESKTPLQIVEPEAAGSTRAIFEINNNVAFTRGAVHVLEREPPDFIYQRYARFGWAGVVATLRTGRPLFLEYNGSEVWVGRHWDHVGMLDLLTRYERLNLNAAARIFVVSDVERRNLEGAGVEANKIIVNPNGVDTNTFRPGIGGQAVRDELAIDEAQTLVGFVSSFGPWHGVLTLVEAIKEIPATSGVRFLLVGSGSLLGQVRQLLAGEEHEGRVIFTGAVGHEQVPAMLDACDVLVSPHVPLAEGTEFFGSPTKIFEYMAMGKGIVASRLGQIGEVLRDGESALLVEPGNAGQLSEAIIRLAESRDLRERLGERARRDAIERHTWKRNARNVLDAYSSWLEEVKS